MGYLAAALITVLLAFAGGWTTNQWRHDAEQKQAAEQATRDQQALRRLEQARASAAIGAQVVARQQETRLRADAAASRGALDSLRDTTSAAIRAATADTTACLAVSAALGDLLNDSADAYQRLATKADEHLIDLKLQLATP
jgi:hypothetical protein